MTENDPSLEYLQQLPSQVIQGIMTQAEEVTNAVSQDTVRQYKIRIQSVARSLGQDLEHPPYPTPIKHRDPSTPGPSHLTPVEFVNAMIQLNEDRDWAVGTWRLTRSALAYIFSEKIANGSDDEKLAYVHGFFHLRNIQDQQENAPRTRRKESRGAQQHITPTEIGLILDRLNDSRRNSFWPTNTALFMMASLVTGLRPVEWETAVWNDESRTELQVKTAKSKLDKTRLQKALADYHQRRGTVVPTYTHENAPFPPKRNDEDPEKNPYENAYDIAFEDEENVYRLVPVEAEDSRWVDAHLNSLQHYLDAGGKFKNYYDACRIRLWQISQELFGSRRKISLYTMRHQFAANSRVIRGHDETAKVMGNSRRSLQDYSGARVAHVSVRKRLQGIDATSPAEKAAREFFLQRAETASKNKVEAGADYA